MPLHKTLLSLRSEVRVPMRGLLRAMTELSLNRLDGLPTRGGLAGHGVPPDGVPPDAVMAQEPQSHVLKLLR